MSQLRLLLLVALSLISVSAHSKTKASHRARDPKTAAVPGTSATEARELFESEGPRKWRLLEVAQTSQAEAVAACETRGLSLLNRALFEKEQSKIEEAIDAGRLPPAQFFWMQDAFRQFPATHGLAFFSEPRDARSHMGTSMAMLLNHEKKGRVICVDKGGEGAPKEFSFRSVNPGLTPKAITGQVRLTNTSGFPQKIELAPRLSLDGRETRIVQRRLQIANQHVEVREGQTEFVIPPFQSLRLELEAAANEKWTALEVSGRTRSLNADQDVQGQIVLHADQHHLGGTGF